MIVYSKPFLLSLKPAVIETNSINQNINRLELFRHKRKKRGKSGGVKKRMKRRKHRPVLPVVIHGNVRSINNKIDELRACTQFTHDYRNVSAICVTETHLKPSTPDSCVDIDNFKVYRCDRDAIATGKTKNGGVCAYVNERWCHPKNTHVTNRISNTCFELLSLSLRPYYLPREFSKVNLNVVYISPDSNATAVMEHLVEIINIQMQKSPDCIMLLTGDFNHVSLDRSLSLHQHVTCPTRGLNTLDHFYSNIKGSYKCRSMASLGKSDHNMIWMMPKYKTKLKSVPVIEKKIKVWDEESKEALRGCFASTDWNVFIESEKTTDELVDVVNEYILFCENNVIKTKTVKCYGNQKPWVTKELKSLIKEKNNAFKNGDKDQQRAIQRKVKNALNESKRKYKERIEKEFHNNNMKGAWQHMKLLSGMSSGKSKINIEQEEVTEYVNQLNQFYARFDCYDFSSNIQQWEEKLTTLELEGEPTVITEDKVEKTFRGLKQGKASGPDNISSTLLKMCAEDLSYVFSFIYNQSLASGKIPQIWKTSKITPVPKSPQAKEMNDFRPVALTPIPMKCLERIVKNIFTSQIQPFMDPHQFAYTASKGVDDALLLFTNNVYKHLDVPQSYVRTLFIDFSSAFNTIQPHLLVPKLLDANISPQIARWILNFLTNRPQFVSINDQHSNIIVTNTGAPQGTVLSPALFSIYTNDCRSNDPHVPMIKFADDTTIQALITKTEHLGSYYSFIEQFVQWCKDNYLQLNVKKTKELIFDFRKNNNVHEPVQINDEKVDRVNTYKYLGVIIDQDLNWTEHANKIISKMKTRLYLMRKLHYVGLDNTLLIIFYKTCLMSVLNFCLCAWGGNLRENEKTKMDRILKHANYLLSDVTRDTIDEMYKTTCNNKMNKIIRNEEHVLNKYIQFSVRSGRLIHCKTRTTRHQQSFLPFAVRHFTMKIL